MKYYPLVLTCFAACLLFTQCVHKESQIATVQIECDKPVSLHRFDPLSFSSFPSLIDSLGGKATVELNLPIFYNLLVGELSYPVYLEPGDNLSVRVENDTIIYRGRGASLNQQIASWLEVRNSYEKERSFFRLSDHEFESRLDSLRIDFDAIKKQIDLDQRDFLEDLFTAYELILKQNYSLMHYNFYEQSAELPSHLVNAIEVLPSISYLEDLEYADYLIALHLYNDAFLGPNIWKKEFNENDSLQSRFNLLVYDKIDSLLSQQNLVEFFKAKTVFIELQTKGLYNQYDVLVEEFQSDYPSSDFLGSIKSLYEELTQIDDQPFPDIPLLDRNGNEVRLADYKGKVIYLDIWATWCGPCIKEFPSSRRLSQKLQGEDVKFVYLSVDSDAEKWRAFLDKNWELKGIHLIEKNGISVRGKLGINGIPRYMLIDKNGVVNSSHAAGPSSDKAENMIRALL